ncbi:oxidoreductase [Aureococcus anophagefferens]|nr:oxidoreductase [Aureococcus anophagefferens]
MGPSPQESAREEMMAVLKANGSASDYEKALTKFVAAGGSSDDSWPRSARRSTGCRSRPGAAGEEGQGPPAAIVPFDFMKQFMKDTLVAYGVPEAEAETSAEVLIEADRRGIDSHGIGRLKPIYCDRMDQGILFPHKPIDVVRESPTSALVDGNLGLGLYVGPYCMKLAIEKAKKHGVGFVVAQNSTHYGIAGYYATMASDAGCVGLTGTNARPSIAPTFGTEPMLGTNPLCFGIPTKDGFPFCIDCATSLGKCALTPVGGAGDDMGGYKGYGWAATVELLCTAFQSGPFGEAVCGIDRATGAKKPMPLGHFFLAIDIAPLCPLDTFERNSTKLLDALRGSRKAASPCPTRHMTDLRDKIPAQGQAPLFERLI